MKINNKYDAGSNQLRSLKVPKKPIVNTELNTDDDVQRMVNLRSDVKLALDDTLDAVNVARRKAGLSKINRSDLVSLMIKKINKSDYLSSNF
jgi:hypothetical protein